MLLHRGVVAGSCAAVRVDQKVKTAIDAMNHVVSLLTNQQSVKLLTGHPS